MRAQECIAELGDVKTYMKTCRRHNYTDLPGERERLETFWPPESK